MFFRKPKVYWSCIQYYHSYISDGAVKLSKLPTLLSLPMHGFDPSWYIDFAWWPQLCYFAFYLQDNELRQICTIHSHSVIIWNLLPKTAVLKLVFNNCSWFKTLTKKSTNTQPSCLLLFFLERSHQKNLAIKFEKIVFYSIDWNCIVSNFDKFIDSTRLRAWVREYWTFCFEYK